MKASEYIKLLTETDFEEFPSNLWDSDYLEYNDEMEVRKEVERRLSF